MVKGRTPRESNPLPGEKPGFVASHDTTGKEDYERTSPLNPLPVKSIGDSNVKDVAVKAELELIKQGIADNKATNDLILARLDNPLDTHVTGSNVELFRIASTTTVPSKSTLSLNGVDGYIDTFEYDLKTITVSIRGTSSLQGCRIVARHHTWINDSNNTYEDSYIIGAGENEFTFSVKSRYLDIVIENESNSNASIYRVFVIGTKEPKNIAIPAIKINDITAEFNDIPAGTAHSATLAVPEDYNAFSLVIRTLSGNVDNARFVPAVSGVSWTRYAEQLDVYGDVASVGQILFTRVAKVPTKEIRLDIIAGETEDVVWNRSGGSHGVHVYWHKV